MTIQAKLDPSSWTDINPLYTLNSLQDKLGPTLAISQGSLYNLFNTTPGDQSRIFRADYGSFWKAFLQENINDVTATKMLMEIEDSITKWEPRIQLRRQDSFVRADLQLPGYRVRISYVTKATGIPNSVSFSVKA